MEKPLEQRSHSQPNHPDAAILPFSGEYLDSGWLSLGTGTASLAICLIEIMAQNEAMDIGLDLALTVIIFGFLTRRRDQRWP